MRTELLGVPYRHSPAPTAMAPPSGHQMCALTAQLCCLEPGQQPGLGRRVARGKAEPGPVGPPRRRWLGSAFPRLRLPADASGRRAPPTPAPGMFSAPLSSPRAGPWGPLQPHLPFPGAQKGAQRAGRLGSYPLPSQKEIPPRSPQALGSQNNPAGEGRLREGARGAEPGGGGCRCLRGEGARERGRGGGAPTSPRSPGSSPSPGSPWPLATPRVGRKSLGQPVSQLVGCTIPGRTV